jgi:hypothetical protein
LRIWLKPDSLAALGDSATEESVSENVARLFGVVSEAAELAFCFEKFSLELCGVTYNGDPYFTFVTGHRLPHSSQRLASEPYSAASLRLV